MKFYFSGLNSYREEEMVKKAGIDRVMVDVFDVGKGGGFKEIILDSGAYRRWKRGKSITLKEYYQVIGENNLDGYVSFDFINNGKKSFEMYKRMVRDGYEPIPVWHYGTNKEYLKYYLENSEVVGIGGLVPQMRNKDEKMLKEVIKLCKEYPNRFHIFGINWCRAINKLKDLIYSADSSLWLDGARYGHLVFVHKKGYLTQAPLKYLDIDLTREERCIESAKNINKYLNSH